MKSNNLVTYCITQKKFNFLKKLDLNFIISGSKKIGAARDKNWFRDDIGKNISKKNRNFGTLTSIYWIWKNRQIYHKKYQWIAISHYRRFWLKEKYSKKININNLNNYLLSQIPVKKKKYDAFVLSPQNVSEYKLIKILKKGKKNILKNPLILFKKNLRTINLQFDMFHIFNGLEKASDLLSEKEKINFKKYINSETKYYPFSLFILKKDKFDQLCKDTFNWIFKCEKIFNTKNLKKYGEVRIFDFLAERYFSFWIINNTKYSIMPGIYLDSLNKNKKNKL